MAHVVTASGLQCRDTDTDGVDVCPTDAFRAGRHRRVTGPDGGIEDSATPTETPHG